jgi:hypothetical protein
MVVLFEKNVLIWSKDKREDLKLEAAQIRSLGPLLAVAGVVAKKVFNAHNTLNVNSVLGDIK